MAARLIYRDIAPGAREGTTPAMVDLQPFSDINDLLLPEGVVQVPRVATLEDDFWRLDGTFDVFPDDPSGLTWGLWSAAMAGADGAFGVPPLFVLQLDGLYSSVGMALTFDAHGPTWPAEMTVTWYRAGAVIDTLTAYPDRWDYNVVREVQLYDRVEIRFLRMSHPWRYLKLAALEYGIIRIFRHDEFFGLSFVQEISAISEEVPVNTLSCTLRNTSSIPFLLQRAQPLEAWDGEDLLGVYYIDTGKQTGRYAHEIAAVDLLGRLDDGDQHKGGIYTGTPAGTVVADIMGDIPYELDAAFAAIPLHGWLPLASRRANLAQVAFAVGAAVDTSRARVVRIYALPDVVSSDIAAEDRAYIGGSVQTARLITGVQVTVHDYIATANTTELFSGAVSDLDTIVFSEPMHTLSITGGTIVESGANYAVISGSGTVVLTGRRYAHTTRIVRRDNPLIPAGDPVNLVEVPDATLTSEASAEAVVGRVYDRYARRETVRQRIVLGGERPGDKVRTDTDFAGTKVGTILSLDIALSGTTAAEAVILVG